VRKLGPNVTSVKVGDRVGFGYTRKVCGRCQHCLSGMTMDQSFIYIPIKNSNTLK
jgi:D-arabinose 1-dehydrogenase-like Zn-dependent alcohol dehydrogenase